MDAHWQSFVRRYRLRHGLSQARLAGVLGVAQRTVSRWERGEDSPSLSQQKRLRDLGFRPPHALISSLAGTIAHCPAARALCRGASLELQALSQPALAKRPSMANWIGRSLRPLACGVLADIFDDRALQRAIVMGEVQGLVTTTRSVLRTAEHDSIGVYRTTITYFMHEGALYSDAIGVPVADTAICGYQPIPMDPAIY